MITYNIEKVRGNSQYIITENGKPLPGTAGDKKKVAKAAAAMNGMTCKEFMKLRKEVS